MLLLRRAPANPLLYKNTFRRVSLSASGCLDRSMRWQSTQSGDPWPALQSLQELRHQDPTNTLFNKEPKELKHARFDGACFHSVYVGHCSAPSGSHLARITLNPLPCLFVCSQAYKDLLVPTSLLSCSTSGTKQVDPRTIKPGSSVLTPQKQTSKPRTASALETSNIRQPGWPPRLQSKGSSKTRLLFSMRLISASCLPVTGRCIAYFQLFAVLTTRLYAGQLSG